jgi:hypothetical protein
MEFASEMNKEVSNINVDELTTLINVGCSSGSNFTYYYQIDTSNKMFADVKFDEIKNDVFALLKKQNINRFCSREDYVVFLDVMDSVSYSYEDSLGVFVGSFELTKADCFK